jgi:hypothetical protein
MVKAGQREHWAAVRTVDVSERLFAAHQTELYSHLPRVSGPPFWYYPSDTSSAGDHTTAYEASPIYEWAGEPLQHT